MCICKYTYTYTYTYTYHKVHLCICIIYGYMCICIYTHIYLNTIRVHDSVRRTICFCLLLTRCHLAVAVYRYDTKRKFLPAP